MSAQSAEALAYANRVRSGRHELRREIADGSLSLNDALVDPRASVLTLYELLCALPRWGDARAEAVCRPERMGVSGRSIWPLRRVGQLTENEKRLVLERAAIVGRVTSKRLVLR